ncbi:hypothetical protein IL54_4115 [Sphingobium sp. ba1]|nr:hypothetical protein IL54_4115 [Sphingobium sp. ba1]
MIETQALKQQGISVEYQLQKCNQ